MIHYMALNTNTFVIFLSIQHAKKTLVSVDIDNPCYALAGMENNIVSGLLEHAKLLGLKINIQI